MEYIVGNQHYEISTFWVTMLVIGAVWATIWKGFALWRAAQNKQPVWFIVLMVVNTLGILEILYLFAFSKKVRVSK